MTMREWLDSVKSRNPVLASRLGSCQIVGFPRTAKGQAAKVKVKFAALPPTFTFDMERQ